MSEQQIKNLVSEVLNWNYPDIVITPVIVVLDNNTTPIWSPIGSEVLFISQAVLTYDDELYFTDADKLYIKLKNSIQPEAKLNFNFGGPTGHHGFNPMNLNWIIDVDVSLMDNGFPAAGTGYLTLTGYILDLVP